MNSNSKNMRTPLCVSVIIVTLNRPNCVQRCLDCLYNQTPLPNQIIVVDASSDDLTRTVIEKFADVLYLRNDNGYGRMTASRNIGLRRASGDLIAFLDDDAFAHAGWLSSLIATYGDNLHIGMVGGRALNNQPSEETEGAEKIGRLNTNGTLTGYFAADPGCVVEVDHVMGCNMSYRREVIAELGGFREDYPGISGVREDTDMCLRVRQRGYKILFDPCACVTHIGAPQARGKRFDLRYNYFSARNHCTMLIRNYGVFSPVTLRYFLHTIFDGIKNWFKKIIIATLRLAVSIGGTVIGIFSGISLLAKTKRDPIRRDSAGIEITNLLSRSSSIRNNPTQDTPYHDTSNLQ